MWQNRRWKPPAIPALAVSLVAVLSFGAPRADAEPRVTGEVVFEVQNDWTYDSEDPNNELNDLFTTTEPDINFYATDGIYLNAHLTLEPVLDPEPRDDRFFEDHGLFVEALSLNLERGRFHVFGGKFGPNFSIAFDAAPGIYGTDISEDDIEISEQLGVGGDVLFGSERVGTHALSASVFFADTTALSESAFENRGRVNVRDGGPSNTGDLSSFAVGLDGGGF
ncbi:MAG: hypothetical protein ACE5DS_02310, partial [Kiloniellaceae bacterium]